MSAGGPRFGSRLPRTMISVYEDRRSAVVLNAGQEAVFRDVPLHPDATLEVALGIPTRHFDDLSSPVKFEVLAATEEEGRIPLAERALHPGRRPEHRDWIELEVPLPAERLGETIDLILRARSPDRDLDRLAAWSDPLIVSDGRETPLPEGPPTRRTVARDLLEEVQSDPASDDGVKPLLLSATQQAGSLPALAIEPGRSVSWELAPLDSQATLHVELFARPLSRRASGHLASRVAVEAPGGGEVAALETPLLEEPLARKEIGIRCFSRTLPLPPCDRPRTLEVRLEGQVEEGRLIAGLSKLRLTTAEPLPARRPGSGPNVLLLLVDTLRADHLGVYGYRRPTSPQLEALAAEGLVFEHAVSQSSWTLPATASLMTGLYPQTHGCLDFSTVRLRRGLTTFPEQLQEAGYLTAGFSANFLISRKNGFDQGFSHFEDLFLFPARDLNASFLAWLEGSGHRPFFAYLHYYDPHYPYSAPPPFDDHFSESLGDEADQRWLDSLQRFGSLERSLPLTRMPWRVVPELEGDLQVIDGSVVVSEWLRQRWIDRYDGEIRYWDTALGELLAALEERGLRDETWIIVTSDHGEAFGEHEFIGHAGNLYEELTRVPLIVVPPGGTSGQRVAGPVELRDLARTTLDLLSVESEVTGQSLLPVDAPRERLAAFSYLRRGNVEQDEGSVPELASMNLDEWKTIQSIDGAAWELFDLSRDPGETSNLSEAGVPPRDRLRAALEGWIRETPRARPEDIDAASEAARAQLRALGYFGR